MKEMLMNRILLRAAIAVFCSLAALPALAASTAKSAWAEVVAAAKRWQPDAVITHLSTMKGNADGTAAEWLYTAYSPAMKRTAILTARDKKIELLEVHRNTITDPLGEFIDSDKAVAVAVKAGLPIAPQAHGVWIALSSSRMAKVPSYWAVTLSTKEGYSAVTLGGRDGVVITRDVLKN
jgi:hypothetical protein